MQIQGYPSGVYSVMPNCSYLRRPSAPVYGIRVGELAVDPTARTFLAFAGRTVVQPVWDSMSLRPPKFPAAKTRRCCGFCSRQIRTATSVRSDDVHAQSATAHRPRSSR